MEPRGSAVLYGIKDNVLGICAISGILLHFREIGGNSDFFSVLQIDDKYRRCSRVKLFVGEECREPRPVDRAVAFVLSPAFGLADIDGLDPLRSLLQFNQCALGEILVIAA